MGESQNGNGQHYECSVKEGYVLGRIWGKLTVPQAEACAEGMMKLGEKSRFDKCVIDINELIWVNDRTLRRRGMELFHKGRPLFKHLALVSTRPAITVLVALLAQAGGFDAKAFDSLDKATLWVRNLP